MVTVAMAVVNPLSTTDFLVLVLLNMTVSPAAGTVPVDQLAPQDHLLPSPALPPQVPSVPAPVQVTLAPWTGVAMMDDKTAADSAITWTERMAQCSREL